LEAFESGKRDKVNIGDEIMEFQLEFLRIMVRKETTRQEPERRRP
jgi:hypothetical protein